jgi:hypothetical protein
VSAVSLDYTYRYRQPSALLMDGDLERLFLATTSTPEASPLFFQGSLRQPRRAADLLLALSRVVRTRFHIPAAMLAKILAEADPVVTCSEDRVRFEGFSACCGVYARVDFLPEALDGSLLGHGTTNVDFNPPMRAALAGIREREPVRLSVGASEVEVTRESGSAVERKVPLPVRWLKGFVEAQAHQSRMSLRMEVDGAEARRFLRALPRSGTGGKPAYVTSLGRGLRLSQVASKLAVRIAGVERLLVLEDLVRHARKLRIYASDTTEASGWELVTDDARFHLVVSPEVWRGFSGEGQALTELAADPVADATHRVRGALRWQSRLDADALARECDLPRREALLGLASLGAAGIVGYDLAEGAYFHRELPYDLSRLEALHPRLRDARKLVAEGGVRIERQDADGVDAWVRGSDVEHRVRLTPEGARCTCPWWSKHQGDRGPCKHVLAAQLQTGGEE